VTFSCKISAIIAFQSGLYTFFIFVHFGDKKRSRQHEYLKYSDILRYFILTNTR